MYVAFEGPIAAGKTTLATLFSHWTSWQLVLEDFSGNEFLQDFYENKERWAFHMQLWFLLARHQQLTGLPEALPNISAGYAYFKNEVFASFLMQTREADLFRRTAAILGERLIKPDALVYLDARDDILLQRIARRGRSYEVHIDSAYLKSLRNAYELRLQSEPNLEVVRIDTSNLDLSNSEQMLGLFQLILNSANSS